MNKPKYLLAMLRRAEYFLKHNNWGVSACPRCGFVVDGLTWCANCGNEKSLVEIRTVEEYCEVGNSE